jgi:photosystem II stability/assembly factor-like uncharacterized protein
MGFKQPHLPVLALGLLLSCSNAPKEKALPPSSFEEQPHAAAKAPADTAFTRQVIYRSLDRGATWEPASSGLSQDVQASFFEKKGTEIVLATDNRGLFISENNRTAWKNIGQSLPGRKVNALHVSGDELYVGLHGQGVFVSSDNGGAWRPLNQGLPNLNVRAFVKHQSALVAGTDAGIFKKQEGATTWTQQFSGAQINSLNQEEGKIIAGTTVGVLLSADGGETWQVIHHRGALHSTAIAGGQVFALYISGDVFISADWGTTWNQAFYAPRKQSYVYELTRVNNDYVMSNNYGVFRSTDTGNTWALVHPEERMVFMDFIVFDSTLYGGTRTANEYRNRRK